MRFKLALKWLAIGLILGLSVDTLAQTNVANSAADLAGKILMVADSALGRTVTNLFLFDRGAAVPFAVGASSLKVTNLDADKLDGIDSTGFVTPTGSVTLTNKTLTAPVLSGTPTGSWTNPTLVGLTNTALADFSGASAGQIKFPSSQNASANANTLDDYKEGMFTPVIGGSGGTSGQTYSAQVGRYTKIGNRVFIQAYAALSAKGTITTSLQFQGLPFTSENTATQYAVCPVWFNTLNTNWINVVSYVNPNATTMDVVGTQAAATSMTSLVTADVTNSTALMVACSYTAAN